MKEVSNAALDVEASAPLASAVRWLELAKRSALALLLDLDGTLIPFAATPDEARIDRSAARLLEALQRSGIQIVIVSGRPLASIERERIRVHDVWWVAEHGSWRCAGGEWEGPPSGAAELDDLAVSLEALARVPGARLERKSMSICLHWRQVASELHGKLVTAAQLLCDEWLETRPELERIDGVEMLEVRVRSANKSLAVAWVRERLPSARIVAIGDDVTDEDMFAALGPGDAAIAASNRHLVRSRVDGRLAGPMAVRAFLRWLLDARMGNDSTPPPLDDRELRARDTRARTKLLVVSNRTPPPNNGDRQRSVGGMVSALEPALSARGGTWLGWSGHERDGEPSVVIDDDVHPRRACFDLPPELGRHFYAGFCNRALWPLLHSFPSRVAYSDRDWRAYVDANDRYAAFAAELVDPDGVIWVHDFHLLLLARALRRRGHRGPIGLFLHVPFPTHDLFETLPWHRELIAGMLDFDLLGFHTARWADHFRETARALGDVTIDGDLVVRTRATTAVGVFPIGIDTAGLSAPSGAISPDIAGLRSALGERRMILGVDRLDYSKGIPERLIAFEHLLERTPEWRGKVSLVQVSVPSRADVPEYAELRHRVENLVGRINGRYGETDWVPVRYLYRSYDRDVLAELYRLADVALVTPLRDGMNLVAKEFVAAQDADRPGVLVLSRFAGAAEELVDAVLTNPFHAEGLALDLDRALRMPLAERVARQARLLAAVVDNTPARWADAFLVRLAATRAS